ncbi:MAG TPA: phosphotransferase [Clostridiales bacterium]|nr:phosphotransferase [Clostridiales bacterium]
MQQSNAVIEDSLQEFLQQRDTICAILGITPEEIQAVSPMGGLTNRTRNFKVDTPGKSYTVRLGGDWSGEVLERKAEYLCAKLAHRSGIPTNLLHFDEQTGMKICHFIPGVAMTPEMMGESQHIQQVAEIFHRLHSCGETVPVDFDYVGKLNRYENQLRRLTSGEFFPDYDRVRGRVLELFEQVSTAGATYVPCHNDPVLENFILGEDGKIYLIDWEYGGMNDFMWDLAALSLECGWDTPREQLFIKYYFGKEVTPEIWRRFLIFKIFPDFLWSVWGRIWAAEGGDSTDFDYYAYGAMRYHRAVRNLSTL